MKLNFREKLRGGKKRLTSSKSGISRMDIAKAARADAHTRAKFFKKKLLSKATRQKLMKIGVLLVGILFIVGAIGGVWFFSYLQRLNQELPPLDNPFGDKDIASIVYDRKGRELYKVIGNINRDPVDIKQIPPHVKFAFLAAEDIDFYSHQGFDPVAIVRCGLIYVRSAGKQSCGGSTITQQVVKMTVVGDERALERKLKELLMAVKIEQAYTKDEIIQLYLTVAPFGSNISGVTTASRFYFGKEPKDLDLAEAAILASIVQNPSYLSPTKPVGDVEVARTRLKERQEYVLHQFEVYMTKINDQHRKNIEDPEADDIVTQDMIDQARNEDWVSHLRPPVATDIKAGHFVNYALDLLQKRNYKNGEEPFTLTDLQNGGYKIYTTLDYDLQQIAERSVADAVVQFGPRYNFSNAALMTTNPRTGEIITMVGSKSFTAPSEPAGCQGAACRFNPQVNILNSKQSPGSSTKPMGTYEAYRQGKLFPGSLLPDVFVDVGGGYVLKNWNSSFLGVNDQTTAMQMLRVSRNFPAIFVLEAIGGTEKFIEVMRSFGYTTYQDPSQYGPSIILGGSDVLPIEHAQGYGVFATGGYLVEHEVIVKIEDRKGNVVYEHVTPKTSKVADERAVYLLNESLNNNHQVSWDGRAASSKSGTSENSTDAWIVMWSPDFVSLAWVGNNNNENMALNAFGETAVVPWIKNYMRQVGDSEYFAARSGWQRPAGIVEGGGCSGDCIGEFAGLTRTVRLGGVNYAVDNIRTRIRVCVDQPNRLARPIDEALGKAQDAVAIYYRSPVPAYQRFIDEHMQKQYDENRGPRNGGPALYCDIDRSGSGSVGPFFLPLTAPAAGSTVQYNPGIRLAGNIYAVTGTVTSLNMYFDSEIPANLIGTVTPATNGSFDQTFPISNVIPAGTYNVILVATDSTGNVTRQTIAVNVVSALNTGITVSAPASSYTYCDVPGPCAPATTIGAGSTGKTITATFTAAVGSAASPVSNVQLFVNKDGAGWTLQGNMAGSCTAGGCTYTYANWGPALVDDNVNSTYQLRVVARKYVSGVLTSSPDFSVTVVE